MVSRWEKEGISIRHKYHTAPDPMTQGPFGTLHRRGSPSGERIKTWRSRTCVEDHFLIGSWARNIFGDRRRLKGMYTTPPI